MDGSSGGIGDPSYTPTGSDRPQRLPVATSGVGARDSTSNSPIPLQSEDGEVEEAETLPSGPVLSEYEIYPALQAIRPTLNELDERLTAITEKLDLALSKGRAT